MMRKLFLTVVALLAIAAATGPARAQGIAVTADDLGKVICTDGSVYATVNAAMTAGKTAAAMIACIDMTNHTGLALALADEYVFYDLFGNNANLKDASGLLLPAPALVQSCYSQMFDGCTNLSSVTCLATSGINISNSTNSWLNNAGTNVTGTKTFRAAASATWPEDNSGIPSGWTRVNADN